MSLLFTGLEFAGELFVVIIRRLGRGPRTPEGVTQEAASLGSHHFLACIIVCLYADSVGVRIETVECRGENRGEVRRTGEGRPLDKKGQGAFS